MDQAKLYPKYRFVMGALNFLCAMFTHAVFVVLNPVLTNVALDFGVTEAVAGYASTMHVVAMGIFLFAGSVIIGKIDVRKTQLLGLTVEILGTVATFFAPSFPLLLVARFISGAGHGMAGSCTNTIVAAWFPQKERSVVVTINSLGNAAIIALMYTLTVPLFHAFGDSWRWVVLSIGGVLLVLDILWLIFARDNHELNEYMKQVNTQAGKKTNAFSGMKEALTRRDVWLLCLFMALSTIASQGVTTYLPQFLHRFRDYTDAAASAVVGVTSGVGALFTFLGGSITTILGRRKIVIVPSLIAGVAFLAMTLVFRVPWMISGSFMVYTLLSNLRTPASQTIATELKNGSPALTSAAAAMSFGIGFVGSPIATPLYQLGTSLFGEQYAMLLFLPLFGLSLLFILLLAETGPGRLRDRMRVEKN